MDEEDESLKLALQLQMEEDAEAERLRKQRLDDEAKSDEALAKMLEQEINHDAGHSAPYNNYSQFMGNASQNRAPPRQDIQGGKTRFKNMRAGENIVVRLHHPHTGSHIGESLRAQYLTTSEVRFELVNDPGKFLYVNEDGKVEFRTCEEEDHMCRYRFELTLNDRVYLKCAAHLEKMNIGGEMSWFLALTADGQLVGNSPRGPPAQWSLVASEEPQHTRPPVPPTNTESRISGAFGAFNPFSKKAGAAKLATDDNVSGKSAIKDDDMHMNPLFFSDSHSLTPCKVNTNTSSTLTKQNSISDAPNIDEVIRNTPQFLSFLATLPPFIASSVKEDPSGFVKSVQSAEFRALLDALPSSSGKNNDAKAEHKTSTVITDCEPVSFQDPSIDEEVSNIRVQTNKKRVVSTGAFSSPAAQSTGKFDAHADL